MSAYGLKPHFTDAAGYRLWMAQWRALYQDLSTGITAAKHRLKRAQRAQEAEAGALHKKLCYQRAMAYKLMGLRGEALARWRMLKAMRQQITEQMASFPLTLTGCKTVDFHFNRGHLEFPDLPMWIVKAKGQTYYIHHLSARCSWSTREVPSGSTRGMLRFRHCDLHLDAQGEAHITEAAAVTTAIAA